MDLLKRFIRVLIRHHKFKKIEKQFDNYKYAVEYASIQKKILDDMLREYANSVIEEEE